MQKKRQRIRDPLHNLIEFFCDCDHFERTLWQVIQTRSFQRLRRIKQLGFSEYTYPGATHSRFSHSLGTYHIAKHLLRLINSHMNGQFEELRAKQALAAALVHDVGHGPFSHAFEEVGKRLNLKMARHEEVSDEIIRRGDIGEILDQGMTTGFSSNVADLIKTKEPSKIYGAIVSSQFDADRLDYMQRDRLMTGTQLAQIDFEWLMANLEIGEVPWGDEDQTLGTRETFVLGAKSIHAAEAYVLGLFQLYPTVYYHKATRGAEKLFTELLLRIHSLVCNDARGFLKANLTKTHPLVVFLRDPESLDNALSLDDTVIMGTLALMRDAKDPLVSDFADRLHHRQLYKCIDVRDSLMKEGIKEDKMVLSIEKIRQKLEGWKNEGRVGTRILIDEGKRDPYKRMQEDKSPLNQIMIKTPSGKIIDISEQSDIVRSIRPFDFFRVYLAAEDREAREFVENAIKGEKNGKKNKK